MDFKAPRELHGSGEHSNRNCLPNQANFRQSRAWKIVQIFNTDFLSGVYFSLDVDDTGCSKGLDNVAQAINTLKTKQNGRHFLDGIFKYLFFRGPNDDTTNCFM